jgi:hypothetical protein
VILRKPYALLIKNFKAIHLIITLLTGSLLFRTSSLLNFFNETISGSRIIQGYDITRELFNNWMFINPVLIVVISVTILSLMYIKKKPIFVYLVNIITYTALFALYYYALVNVDTLEVQLVDIRVLRAIRDFLMGGMLIQTITFFFMFVRATGFDIKKFNFTEDLDDLDISEEDREEFELELTFDLDKLVRKYKKQIRYIKYTYLENKFFINLIASVSIVGITIYTLVYVFVLNKAFDQNIYFDTTEYVMRINDSYTTQKDYRNNRILEDTRLVVLEMNIKHIYDYNIRLDTTIFELIVQGRYFRPVNTYDDQIFDLGLSYKNYNITKEEATYLLIYEIPDELSLKNAIFPI